MACTACQRAQSAGSSTSHKDGISCHDAGTLLFIQKYIVNLVRPITLTDTLTFLVDCVDVRL